MRLSTKTFYNNGNAVALGYDGDHCKVRAILRTGIIPRVTNFGPLLKAAPAKCGEPIIKDGYELYIEHMNEVMGLDMINATLTTAKNVNHVYYQRIAK